MIEDLDPALHRRFIAAGQTMHPEPDVLDGARRRYRRHRVMTRVTLAASTVAACTAFAVAVPSWLGDAPERAGTSVTVTDPADSAGPADPAMGVSGQPATGMRVSSAGYLFDLPPGFKVDYGPTTHDKWETEGIVTRATATTKPAENGSATLMMVTYEGQIAVDAIASWRDDKLNDYFSIDGHKGQISIDNSRPAKDDCVIISQGSSSSSCGPVTLLPAPPRIILDFALDATTLVSLSTHGMPEDQVMGILRSALTP